MSLNKRKTGTILGILSILPVIVCSILFFILRGPNADIYLIITVYSFLSIIGIILAIVSWVMSKRFITSIFGIIANLMILAFAILLLLAMGIGEA